MAGTVNTTVERIVLETVDKGSAASIKGVTGALGEMRAGLDTVTGALAAVGLTVGAGAMLELHRQVLAADAGLKDMAKSAGASVEQLSAIRRVAQVGGHDFQGLQGQLAKTVRGLQENSEEGGKAARAFDFLGVKTRDGQGRFRDMGEVLIEVARKLEKYEDGGNKVALVQDLLGKGAERYLPLLEDIAEGTDLMATVSGKAPAELERTEKEMRRFNVAMEDGRRLLINEYSPAFRELLEQGTEGIKIFGGFWSAFYNIGVGINPFNTLAENIRELNREIAQAETESPYQRALRESVIGGRADVDTMKKRREFLLFQQRQQALRGADDSNLDARDLRLRGGPAKPLDYRTQDSGGDRQAEAAARAMVEGQEMAAAEAREAWDAYRKYFSGVLEDIQHQIKLQADGTIKVTERVVVNQDRLRAIQEERNKALMDAEDERQEQAIAEGQAYLATDLNQWQEHYNNRHNELVRARELGILTQSEFNEREAELTYDHQRRLNGITTLALTELERFKAMSQAKQNATMLGRLEQMTSGAATHSKKWFEVNKQLSTANALVKGYEAVQSAYAFGSAWGGPWGGAAMAAIAALAVGANVAAIQSTQFGGGGAVGTFPASPATGLPVAAQPAASAARGPDTFINISGSESSTLSMKQVRELLERINEATRDGGRIVLSS